MHPKTGLALTKFLATFYHWIGDMAWFFTNVGKVRETTQGRLTHAPYCPRHDARMEFQNEVPYRPPGVSIAGAEHFRRNYKCQLCDYETFTVYVVKSLF